MSLNNISRTICASVAALARQPMHNVRCSNLSLRRHLSIAKPAIKKTNILYTAVCVERRPVITVQRTNLEEKFAHLMNQVEFEQSHLSAHEVRLQKEELSAKKKADEEEVKVDTETETALDLEDKWDAEIKAFTAASRLTEADETDDRKSLDRKLDSSLYLLVRQKIEGRDHWVLPQATWVEGETLRETAERALTSVCGGVKATFLGNAPCSVAKYEPLDPSEERGIKLFFFKAWYQEGTVTPMEEYADDFLWVTAEELPQYCHSGYKKNLRKFIP